PDQSINRISSFLGDEDETVATTAIRLVGLWKLEKLNDQLVSLARNGNLNIKKAALGSLAAIGSAQSKESLLDLTTAKNETDLRILATAQFVSIDADKASNMAVALLKTLSGETDATELFHA